jgi:dTMP kinase
LIDNEHKTSIKKGLFITFEGGEGVGKSTQINLLKKFLSKKSYKVTSTREPGGTKEGEYIRKFLVSGDKNAWDSYSEALIFNALRREHINKLINPAIQNSEIILCDRYVDSTIVYQGLVGKIDEQKLFNLHDTYCYGLYPDLTLFLHLNPEIGLDRTSKRNNKNENRFEKLGLNYHQKILDGFNILYKKYPKRIVKIDASESKEIISDNINYHVSELLNIND